MPTSGSRSPDFEADLYLLTSEEGGRQSGIAPGYYPNFDFGREDGEQNGSGFDMVDGDRIEPGTTARIRVWLMVPELNEGRLNEGQSFTIKEGARVVGRGQITAVLSPALRLAV